MAIPPRGDFSFLNHSEFELMFTDAYQAIEKAGAWETMRSDPGERGYMFTRSAELDTIKQYMTYDGHSGWSYGWTMRMMQRLARIGWEAFVKEYLENQKKDAENMV